MTDLVEWRPYIGEEVRVAEHIALTWPEWRDQPLFVVGLSKDRLGGQYPIDGINVTVSEEWPLTSSTTGFTDGFWIGRLDKPDDLAPVGRAALEQAGEPVEGREVCRECGSDALTWFAHYRNRSQVVEGRLKTSDVECIFVLGCDACSETLRTVPADEMAAKLTEAPLPTLQRLGQEFDAGEGHRLAHAWLDENFSEVPDADFSAADMERAFLAGLAQSRGQAFDGEEEAIRVLDGANSHCFDMRIVVGDGDANERDSGAECIAFANEPWASRIADALSSAKRGEG